MKKNSVTHLGKSVFYGRLAAVYEIDIPHMGSVFMYVSASPYQNDKRAVVIVDSRRFLDAWKASIGPSWLGSI